MEPYPCYLASQISLYKHIQTIAYCHVKVGLTLLHDDADDADADDDDDYLEILQTVSFSGCWRFSHVQTNSKHQKIPKNPNQQFAMFKSSFSYVQPIIRFLVYPQKFLTILPLEVGAGQGDCHRVVVLAFAGAVLGCKDGECPWRSRSKKWGGLSHRYPIKLWLSNPEKECG